MAVKYIADGFQKDAESLLNEFALEESCEFKVFAAIWKKKNFSFIYMGRDNLKEMGEFTNEVFSLSLDYLVSESFWHKIGGVFLLYALYRNQILKPPVRIRVELGKFQILKFLLEKAIEQKWHSMHYVLNYLMQNAFELVATPTLLGPCVRNFEKSANELETKLQQTDFKFNLEEVTENKVLESLHESLLKYEKLKSTPENLDINSHRCTDLINSLKKLSVDRKRISAISANLQMSSRLAAKPPKDTHGEYPHIDSDLNQVSEPCDVSENENRLMIESKADENEALENTMLANKGGQSLECNEKLHEKTIKKFTTRRVVKARKIRKYYEGSPTKDTADIKAIPVSRKEASLEADSED